MFSHKLHLFIINTDTKTKQKQKFNTNVCTINECAKFLKGLFL